MTSEDLTKTRRLYVKVEIHVAILVQYLARQILAMEIDNPKSAKMASPAKSKTELAKNGLPEDDMDSICGMLMQLQSEMGGQIRDPKMEDAGKRSMLRITREERAEAAAFGALVSVMFGEQDMKQKVSFEVSRADISFTF